MRKYCTLEERAAQLRPYLEQGYTTREAAGVIGLSISQANKIVATARTQGLLARRKSDILRGVYTGSIRGLVRQQPEELQRWVRDQIPEGGTVAEFAVSCVVDAYYEDQT